MSDNKTVVNLRTVAERVGLAACSVSCILNKTAASLAIPQKTRDRVLRAAAELNYQPNFSARSLRTKRTHMVVVVSADFSRPNVGPVMAGMERLLRERGYLLAIGGVGNPSEWTRLSVQFQQRGIEGVIALDANLPRELQLPSVSLHLGGLNMPQPLTKDAGAWLAGLGESAAETVLAKIETKDVSRRTRIVPEFMPAQPVQSVQNPSLMASA